MRSLLLSFILFSSLNAETARNKIFFQPNTTQIFTELYQAHGLLDPPARTFFEEALYLDQSIPPGVVPLQPSNEVIFNHADEVLSEFHRNVKDLELYVDPNMPKPFFYTASGSKHLIVALVYAMAMSEPNKKFLFVEQAPYYSGHSNAVNIFRYPNARFVSFHDVSELKPAPDEILVEFVTSPNNPDGKFRKPLTDAKIIIADFVFASSAFGMDGTGYLNNNLAWIKEARAQGKHIFSFNSASKQFGKTGTRVGYIWYPSYDTYAALIFDKFFDYIASSTVAGGSTGLAEFLNLIKAFNDLPDHGKALREEANKSLIKRHELVSQEILAHYPGSTVTSIPGSPTFFAKIKDPRIPEKQAWEVLASDFDVSVNNAAPMGESNEFIRMNLSGLAQGIVDFLNRLAGENKYKVQDVLLTSAHECSSSIVSTSYFVRPGDCLLSVDAAWGPVDIQLSPFFGYDVTEVIIRKIDPSEHPVTIKTDTTTHTLKTYGESINAKWTTEWELITEKAPALL